MIIEEKFNLVRALSVVDRFVLIETSCFLYQILSHHIWVVKEQTKKQQEKKKYKKIKTENKWLGLKLNVFIYITILQ